MPGVRVVHVVVDDDPDRDLSAGVVPYAPVVGEGRDDVQPAAAVRGDRGGRRSRAGRAAAVRDLHQQPAVRVHLPRGPDVAVPGQGVAQWAAVLARIAEQFGKTSTASSMTDSATPPLRN
ncbi:hypothetical protein SVIOM342S_06062 [Streptomyces violaceorubidus]